MSTLPTITSKEEFGAFVKENEFSPVGFCLGEEFSTWLIIQMIVEK